MSEDPNRRVTGAPLPDPQPSQEIIKSLTDTARFEVQTENLKRENDSIKASQHSIFEKLGKIEVTNAEIGLTLEHIQESNASMQNSFGLESEENRKKLEEVKTAGDQRKNEIIDSFSDKMEETHLRISDIIKIDKEEFQKAQDIREAEIEAREIIRAAKEKKKQDAADEDKADKKKTRNKIFVAVVSSLIISGIGFAAMIAWLGFKTYLKHELRMTDMKQEIQQNSSLK